MPNILVWDIETVPDLKGFAAANGHDGKTDDEIRAELGEQVSQAHLPLDRLYRRFSCPLGERALDRRCTRRTTCWRAIRT